MPAIPGLADVGPLDSTAALDLTELPKSMIVLGGGYVGVELAQMFSRAGVKVTLVFRSRLLPEMEPKIGAALSDYLSSEIGRAHVRTPVTNAHLVCRLLL